VVDQVFILLCRVGQDFESFSSQHSSRRQLRPSPPLENVLLVGEVVLPLVETIAQVCLAKLLSVGKEGQPVSDNLSEFDPAPPSIEHLRLQVVLGAVPVLPAGDGSSQEFKPFAIRAVVHVDDLVISESLVSHQLLQVLHFHLLIEHLLHNRSNLVDLDDSLSEQCLALPPHEGVSR